MLDKAQQRLAEVKAEVAQSVGPLKCVPQNTAATPCSIVITLEKTYLHKQDGRLLDRCATACRSSALLCGKWEPCVQAANGLGCTSAESVCYFQRC